MHQKMLGSSASVGLSALLAGLLLVAAKRDYPTGSVASFEMKTEAAAPPPDKTQQTADAPTAIVLPDPPPAALEDYAKKTAKLSKAIMKPLVATKNKPVPAIVVIRPRVKQPAPMVAVQPLLPSPSVPNDGVSDPIVKEVLIPSTENTHRGLKAKNTVTIVLPNEDPALAEEGRVLLRMLEHGRGPAIELAWPDRADDQERLYQTLRDCLGMRIALRDSAGRLYIANIPPGKHWQPSMDRYSGFARKPTGRLAAAERRDISTIAQHHNLSHQASAIRIFPRQIDAQLLGGLRRLVGKMYGRAHNIRAKYRLSNDGVTVTGILVDGRPLAGGVALAALANSGCRA